jgi:hypothetical protein
MAFLRASTTNSPKSLVGATTVALDIDTSIPSNGSQNSIAFATERLGEPIDYYRSRQSIAAGLDRDGCNIAQASQRQGIAKLLLLYLRFNDN